FAGFEDVKAGIVKWPMSTIRLTAASADQLVELSDRILTAWRGYTDEAAFIFAETNGEKHNTVTPIARRRGDLYEIDLVLRNNITTNEHPLGVYHPHAQLHHIKKENIGLIEVMGLAVLPSRLKTELAAVESALCTGADLSADPLTAAHAAWGEELRAKYPAFTEENVKGIVQNEVGLVFATVLEHAGVYKRDDAGREALMRFLNSI
ncbi:MAG: galactose-1-phosphate uridylyltransferase, partial [Clostridia bacterium]|nr:galactose-1-phosphate uridylyltransferase [Clostridia bacterium]